MCDIYANSGFDSFYLLEQVYENQTLMLNKDVGLLLHDIFLPELDELLSFVVVQTRECPTFFRYLHSHLNSNDHALLLIHIRYACSLLRRHRMIK